MLRLTWRQSLWLIIAIVLTVIVIMIVVEHALCHKNPLSRTEALTFALKASRDSVDSSTDYFKSWKSVIIDGESFNEANGTWYIELRDRGCVMQTHVSPCKGVDVAGLGYGCLSPEEKNALKKFRGGE